MININGWHCEIRRATRSFDEEITFWKENGNDCDVLQSDLKTIKTFKPGTEFNGCTLRLDEEKLELIFNRLWENGFRPKDRRYENEMSIINNHLQDMRKLVFKGDIND
jgi:hypothetical protein